MPKSKIGESMKNVFLVFVLMLMAGCTSVQVNKLDSSHQVYHVCIEDNPDVIVQDFISTVRDGFARHGITTEVYEGKMPSHCEYHLTYTALKTWDMAPYMHHAELHLYKGYDQIAYAEYHLDGRGGWDLSKWASVGKKMDPVIDELLSDYTPATVAAFREEIPSASSTSEQSSEPIVEANATERLRLLRKWHEEGLITQEEYDAQKKEILNN